MEVFSFRTNLEHRQSNTNLMKKAIATIGTVLCALALLVWLSPPGKQDTKSVTSKPVTVKASSPDKGTTVTGTVGVTLGQDIEVATDPQDNPLWQAAHTDMQKQQELQRRSAEANKKK